MPIHEYIIQQTKFLGINLYKRTRLEEYEILVSGPQRITEYPGLMGCALHHPFSSDNVGFNTRRIIELTLLSLIIDDVIELVIFTDKKYYLGNIFRNEYKDYRLAVKSEYFGKDFLEQSIFNAVKFVEQNGGKKANLKAVLRHLIGQYIGRFYKPHSAQGAFMIALLGKYSKYSWLKLRVYKGVTDREEFELRIDEKQREELKNAYQTLSNIAGTLKDNNKAFFVYSFKFHKIIYDEFMRHSNNGSS